MDGNGIEKMEKKEQKSNWSIEKIENWKIL